MTSACLLVAQWKQADQINDHKVFRPQLLSCWSKSSSSHPETPGVFSLGRTQGLSYFSQPQLPSDLNAGYPNSFARKDDQRGSPVEQVIAGMQFAAQQAPLIKPGIVSYRNNLNKILGTLVSPRDAWVVDACMYDGTLYLHIHKTPETSFPDADRFQYFGYKFESLCTGGGNTEQQPPVVDSTSEFAIIVQVGLGVHRIVLAAEVDSADPPQSTQGLAEAPEGLPVLTSCLELKTYKPPHTQGQIATLYNLKWPKWWIQSFLAGVETIVLGGRDDAGMLTEVTRISVHTMPAVAAAHGARWDAWQILRFGESVLDWMVEHGHAQPHKHLRFSYQPRVDAIDCQLIEQGEGLLPDRLHAVLGPKH